MSSPYPSWGDLRKRFATALTEGQYALIRKKTSMDTTENQHDYFFIFGDKTERYEIHFHAIVSKGKVVLPYDSGTWHYWAINSHGDKAMVPGIDKYTDSQLTGLKSLIIQGILKYNGKDEDEYKKAKRDSKKYVEDKLKQIQEDKQKALEAAQKLKEQQAQKAKQEATGKIAQAQNILKGKKFDPTKLINTKDRGKYVWERLYGKNPSTQERKDERDLIKWYLQTGQRELYGAHLAEFGDLYDQGFVSYDSYGDSQYYTDNVGIIGYDDGFSGYNYIDPIGIVLGLILLVGCCFIACVCGLVSGGIGGYVVKEKLIKRESGNVEDAV